MRDLPLGPRMLCGHAFLFDGRDAAIVGRFVPQRGEHRVCQNMAAPFETVPVDVLRGIVEFKRIKDGLGVGLSVTVDHRIKIVRIPTSEKALSKPPVPLSLVSIQCTTDSGYFISCVR